MAAVRRRRCTEALRRDVAGPVRGTPVPGTTRMRNREHGAGWRRRCTGHHVRMTAQGERRGRCGSGRLVRKRCITFSMFGCYVFPPSGRKFRRRFSLGVARVSGPGDGRLRRPCRRMRAAGPDPACRLRRGVAGFHEGQPDAQQAAASGHDARAGGRSGGCIAPGRGFMRKGGGGAAHPAARPAAGAPQLCILPAVAPSAWSGNFTGVLPTRGTDPSARTAGHTGTAQGSPR